MRRQLTFVRALCSHCPTWNFEHVVTSDTFPVILLVDSWLHFISASIMSVEMDIFT